MLIGITMGDPNGIGPELILRAHKHNQLAADYLVIGDYDVLDYCNRRLDIGVHLQRTDKPQPESTGSLYILDQRLFTAEDLTIGRISKPAGAAAREYVRRATALALERKIDAITTLPINKEAIALSDPHFTGHTEFIAQLCGRSNITMMLVSEKLVVTHVSTHVPLRDAVKVVKEQRVYEVIVLTQEALLHLKVKPRIAVAGLNPHSGEGGHFGTEEQKEIEPAVQKARSEGIDVSGPYPPDVIFRKAVEGDYDAVVCMYHDQGHIPVKILDFEGGVNVTLGLPIIRTSVDHGTAYDIAYQGKASTRSLSAACNYARSLGSA